MQAIIIFTAVQFVSTLIATFKYSITGTASPTVATLVNCLSVAIGNLATIFLVQTDAISGTIISFVDTLIAVPLARFIIDKLTPDKLYIFTATIECSTGKASGIRKRLKDRYNIHSNYQSIVDNELYSFSIYAKTRADSKIIKNELKELNAKYHIIEAK